MSNYDLSIHYDLMLKFAFKSLDGSRTSWAEDIARDSLYKAQKSIDSFVPEMAKIETWLVAIVKNTANDYLRKKANQEVRRDVFYGSELYAEPEEFELGLNLDKYLNLLSDNERAVITMRFFKGMRAKDIAPIVGIKVNSIPMIAKRALAKLRKAMEKDGYGRDCFF